MYYGCTFVTYMNKDLIYFIKYIFGIINSEVISKFFFHIRFSGCVIKGKFSI